MRNLELSLLKSNRDKLKKQSGGKHSKKKRSNKEKLKNKMKDRGRRSRPETKIQKVQAAKQIFQRVLRKHRQLPTIVSLKRKMI